MAQLTLDSDLGMRIESSLIFHSISTYIPNLNLIVKGVRLLHNRAHQTAIFS